MHIATESLPWCCQAATGAPSSWGGQPNAGPIAKFEWPYARKTPINVHVGEQKLGGRSAIGWAIAQGHIGVVTEKNASCHDVHRNKRFARASHSGVHHEAEIPDTAGRSDSCLDNPLMYQLHSVS